jgi:hypothetical protein
MKIPTNKQIRITAGIAALGAVMILAVGNSAYAQNLTVPSGDHNVHIFPSTEVQQLRALAAPLGGAPLGGPLTYHGGPVMTKATTYAIFWLPSSGKLQNGAATGFSARYQDVQKALLSLYPGHGIDNNNTQYYDQTCIPGLFICFTEYVQNAGGLGGSWVDTSAYPPSGCSDSATPGNCLSDAQIQAEIQKAITTNGWTAGINSIFLLYTSSGEGSCAGASCAYVNFCAYHSYFTSGATDVIYANIPYGSTSACQTGGTPSPNGDAIADTAATAASHELTEAITDPLLNAWYNSSGDEIGDLCAYQYGPNTWASGTANQSWPVSFSNLLIIGHAPVTFFELQEEWNNHTNSCVQVGP